MSQQKSLRLSYEFDVPKKVVFDAFANAEALNEWWGPVEAKNSVISLDFRPGGIFHYKMDFSGHISYGRFLFYQVNPHDLLEFTSAFADEKANVVNAPFDIALPLEILTHLEFTEHKGRTTIHLTATPVNPTPEQLAGFNSIYSSMEAGYGATLAKLSMYLQNQTVK